MKVFPVYRIFIIDNNGFLLRYIDNIVYSCIQKVIDTKEEYSKKMNINKTKIKIEELYMEIKGD